MGGGETHKHLVRNSPPNVVKTNLTLSVEFQYTDGDSQPSSLPFLFDCFTSECAQRVSKPEGNWENTSCFKNSVFSSISSRVGGPDVAFCGQCYALFQRFKSVKSCKTSRDGELKTTDLTSYFQ